MRRTSTALLSTLTLLAALAACASTSTPRTSESSPTRITRAEIEASGASSAYDVINRLRPQWLRATATGSLSTVRNQVILVYLDDIRIIGGVDALRSINASSIGSMQFLDATRAPTVLRDVGNEPIAGAIVMRSTM